MTLRVGCGWGRSRPTGRWSPSAPAAYRHGVEADTRVRLNTCESCILTSSEGLPVVRTLLVGFRALASLASRPVLAQANTSSRYQRPPDLDDGWKTASADSLGVDPTRLTALTEAIRAWPELGVHAILVERAGRLIYEEYFNGYDERSWSPPLRRRSMARDSLHDLRSVTKSVVSALVGIAVDAGAIRSLGQPVIEWFPEYPELNTAERRRLTLAHVLAMTSGLEWNEDVPYNDPRNDEIRMTRDPRVTTFE